MNFEQFLSFQKFKSFFVNIRHFPTSEKNSTLSLARKSLKILKKCKKRKNSLILAG